MSIVDPGVEEAGPGWTRHNISDHDDAATAGSGHLMDVTFNGSTGKWTAGGLLGLPILAAGAGAGAAPPAPTFIGVYGTSTDARMAVQFGTGTAPTASPAALLVVTFATPLPAGKLPFIDIQELTSNTRNLFLFPTTTLNTGFTISYATGTIAASQPGTTFQVIIKVEG